MRVEQISITNRTVKAYAAAATLLVVGVILVQSATGSSAAAGNAGPAEIYIKVCSKCHGADGRAKTSKGKRSGATDLTSDWNRDEERGLRIIANGKGQMPSFKKDLTPEERRSVFEYILRFGRQSQ